MQNHQNTKLTLVYSGRIHRPIHSFLDVCMHIYICHSRRLLTLFSLNPYAYFTTLSSQELAKISLTFCVFCELTLLLRVLIYSRMDVVKVTTNLIIHVTRTAQKLTRSYPTHIKLTTRYFRRGVGKSFLSLYSDYLSHSRRFLPRIS